MLSLWDAYGRLDYHRVYEYGLNTLLQAGDASLLDESDDDMRTYVVQQLHPQPYYRDPAPWHMSITWDPMRQRDDETVAEIRITLTLGRQQQQSPTSSDTYLVSLGEMRKTLTRHLRHWYRTAACHDFYSRILKLRNQWFYLKYHPRQGRWLMTEPGLLLGHVHPFSCKILHEPREDNEEIGLWIAASEVMMTYHVHPQWWVYNVLKHVLPTHYKLFMHIKN